MILLDVSELNIIGGTCHCFCNRVIHIPQYDGTQKVMNPPFQAGVYTITGTWYIAPIHVPAHDKREMVDLGEVSDKATCTTICGAGNLEYGNCT